MLKWKKVGRVFDPDTCTVAGWNYTFAQSPAAVVFDNHVRVYFCSRVVSPTGMAKSSIMRLDLDRNDLSRVIGVESEPILPLGELGCFDEFGLNPVSAIQFQDEVRIYYAGWTRCESVPFNSAIGMAVSRDGGATFQRLGKGPVLSYTPDEPFVLGSPHIKRFKDRWFLYYISGRKWVETGGRPEPMYKIRMATSIDGINWNRLGRDIIPSKLGEDECQASAEVFHHEGKYHMLFSYRQNINFKVPGRGYLIGYACSDDLEHWERDDTQAGLPVSESGWDAETVSYPNVFNVDSRLCLLYQGNGIGQSGFGLAVLEDFEAVSR